MLNFIITIVCLFFLIKYIYKLRKESFIGNVAHPRERIKPLISYDENGILINEKKIPWNKVDFIHFSNNYNGNNIGYYKLYPWIKFFKLFGMKPAENFENALKQGKDIPEKQTLLIFAAGERTPFIINLNFMPDSQAKEVINELNRRNISIDTWRSRFQKIIWD